MLDLLDVLDTLTQVAAQLAARGCCDGAKRNAIFQAAEKVGTAAKRDGRGEYMACRGAFYRMMLALGGNNELARAIPLLRADLFRAQLEGLRGEGDRARHALGYLEIARAIAEQDGHSVDRAVKRHVERSRQTIKELANYVSEAPPQAEAPRAKRILRAYAGDPVVLEAGEQS